MHARGDGNSQGYACAQYMKATCLKDRVDEADGYSSVQPSTDYEVDDCLEQGTHAWERKSLYDDK